MIEGQRSGTLGNNKTDQIMGVAVIRGARLTSLTAVFSLFPSTRRSLALIGLTAVIALLGSACASDGRALQPPSDNQTTTTRPPTPTSALDFEESETGLVLTSPEFEPGAEVPNESTCASDNTFPELRWDGIGDNATELAVTLSDQTDPNNPLLLWLAAGITPAADGLDRGTIPNGSVETLNDYGNLGFGTPCLEGLEAGRRDLQFRVYVLEHDSGIVAGDPGNTSWDTLRAASVDSASLVMRIG